MKKKHKQKKQAENKLLEYLSTIGDLDKYSTKTAENEQRGHSKTSME